MTNVVAQAVTGTSAAPASAAKRQFSLVDTRGIGRPKPFAGAIDGLDGVEVQDDVFSSTPPCPDLDGSLDWAANQKEEIDQELTKQLCNRVGTDTAATDAFAKELHSANTHLFEGEPTAHRSGIDERARDVALVV